MLRSGSVHQGKLLLPGLLHLGSVQDQHANVHEQEEAAWVKNNLAIWDFLMHGYSEMAADRVPACFPLLPNGWVREEDQTFAALRLLCS